MASMVTAPSKAKPSKAKRKKKKRRKGKLVCYYIDVDDDMI